MIRLHLVQHASNCIYSIQITIRNKILDALLFRVLCLDFFISGLLFWGFKALGWIKMQLILFSVFLIFFRNVKVWTITFDSDSLLWNTPAFLLGLLVLLHWKKFCWFENIFILLCFGFSFFLICKLHGYTINRKPLNPLSLSHWGIACAPSLVGLTYLTKWWKILLCRRVILILSCIDVRS